MASCQWVRPTGLCPPSKMTSQQLQVVYPRDCSSMLTGCSVPVYCTLAGRDPKFILSVTELMSQLLVLALNASSQILFLAIGSLFPRTTKPNLPV